VAALSQAQTLPRKVKPHVGRRRGVWATSREAFWIALEALRAHKLRSFLTLLGVVIATATLIVVMSIINGMNFYIVDRIARLGANVFFVHQFKWTTGSEAWLRARRRNQPIRIEEFEFLRDHLKGYKNIGAEAWMDTTDDQARYKMRTVYEVRVEGETPNMIDIGQTKVQLGRYINETDYTHEAMVCFVGQDLVKEFFPSVQDNFVYIPLTTFRKLFRSRPSLAVSIQAANSLQMAVLEDEVRALLRARRHIPYNEDDTFGINASSTLMESWHQLTGTIFAVTIGIVAVFMVVGGIVIMNIMLASVTERTHEIGIRKSLGARRRDILMQFVIESAVMAGSGGAIGIVLALIVSRIVNVYFTSSVPLKAVLLGLLLSTAVGLFFGIYPASKAAGLEPIEALHTEA
jgi:putative ABC transport system permease protein